MLKAEFIELIEMVESFYPGRFKANHEVTASVWWEVLKDYEFHMCRKNLIKHVQVNEWPPAIANLIAGHKDSARVYNGKLADKIDQVRPYDELIAEIEERTGMKVIE